VNFSLTQANNQTTTLQMALQKIVGITLKRVGICSARRQYLDSPGALGISETQKKAAR